MKPVILNLVSGLIVTLTSILSLAQNVSNSALFNDPWISNLWFYTDAKADPSRSGISFYSAYEKYGFPTVAPITVAVIDSGIDYHHEDIKDVLWVNSKEILDNGKDDDNNGYIDDIYGISTYDRDAEGRATGEVKGVLSHGTHLAGIIAGKQNNGLGYAGISANARIMALRSFPYENELQIKKDVAEALLYAAKNGARIINCSFGFDWTEGNQFLSEAFNLIEEKYDVLIVIAAANLGQDQDLHPQYPANFENKNILTVAATDETGDLWNASLEFLGQVNLLTNYGKTSIDLGAPGTNVYGPIVGNGYFIGSGTSQAAAVVSGVAAEVLARHPHLRAIQLKDILMKSVTKKENLADKFVAGGIVDLLGALDLASTIR